MRKLESSNRRRRLQPALYEALECRRLMSVAVWVGASNNHLWSDPNNWQNGVPAPGDDVVFPANANGNGATFETITVDTSATVHTLTLHGSYEFDGTTPLTLESSLIADADQNESFNLPIVIDHSVSLNVAFYAIFTGGISEASPGLNLANIGAGYVNFRSGALSYTGTTDVQAGRFELAAPTSSPFQLASGTTFYGAGTEVPSISASAGAYVVPADDAGYGFISDSGLTLASGSNLVYFLTDLPNGSTLAPTAATVSAGAIDLTGVNLLLENTVGTLTESDPLTLIKNNTGFPVNGTFAGIPEGGDVVSGQGRRYVVSYEGGASGQDVTLTPVPATQLAIVQEPSATAVAGQSIGTIVVDVEDANGDLLSSDSSSVTLSGSNSLSGTTTVQAVNGVAVFSDLSIGQPGTYTLDASDGALAAAVSTPTLVTPPASPTPPPTPPPAPAPAREVVAGTRVGGLVINPSKVFPQSTAASKWVNFRVVNTVGDDATVFDQTVVVRHQRAALKDLRLRTAGAYNVIISDTAGDGVTERLNVVAAAPAKLEFATPVTTIPDDSTLTVGVFDRYGNLCTASNGAVVSVRHSASPFVASSATLAGTLTATISQGSATFNDVSVEGAGPASLVATSGGLQSGRLQVFQYA